MEPIHPNSPAALAAETTMEQAEWAITAAESLGRPDMAPALLIAQTTHYAAWYFGDALTDLLEREEDDET